MFSKKEKQTIASKIETLLLELNHPEMPREKPDFHLSVKGKESWSWAEIDPNWTYDDKAVSVNPWNEIAREQMKSDK